MTFPQLSHDLDEDEAYRRIMGWGARIACGRPSDDASSIEALYGLGPEGAPARPAASEPWRDERAEAAATAAQAAGEAEAARAPRVTDPLVLRLIDLVRYLYRTTTWAEFPSQRARSWGTSCGVGQREATVLFKAVGCAGVLDASHIGSRTSYALPQDRIATLVAIARISPDRWARLVADVRRDSERGGRR